LKPIVKISGLESHYGRKPILHGIDLEISPGDFHLIIGPNGAGKTTLLRAILAMIPISGGSIEIEGLKSQKLTARERARLIGYVPQTLELSFNMDVWSFMELARFAYDDTSQAKVSAIQEAMALTQIAYLRNAYFNELSGGERQRVLLAAALAQRPKILVLDEPASSLDPGHRIELVRLLRELRQREGLTILLVTHDWNEYIGLKPQILAIKQGRLAFQCSANALKHRLAELFDCEFQHVLLNDFWYSLPRYASCQEH